MCGETSPTLGRSGLAYRRRIRCDLLSAQRRRALRVDGEALVERDPVVALRALGRNEPLQHVPPDEFRIALERIAEAAAAGALDHDLVALPQPDVRELRRAD